MTPATSRAPAFLVTPSGSEPSGLQLALSGKLAMASDAALVRQSILLLLSTRPGERVMRPRYGCDLRPLLFLPNDDTTAGLAIHAVAQALARWEPRAIVRQLGATQDPDDPARLNILLVYELRGTPALQRLLLPLDLNGA